VALPRPRKVESSIQAQRRLTHVLLTEDVHARAGGEDLVAQDDPSVGRRREDADLVHGRVAEALAALRIEHVVCDNEVEPERSGLRRMREHHARQHILSVEGPVAAHGSFSHSRA